MSGRGSTFGKRFSRFTLVISALAIGLRLWAEGLMRPEILTIFLLLAVVASALDLVLVKFIIVIFGLGYFLLDFVDYNLNQFQAVAISVGGLIVTLFGYFVMIGGPRSRR